MNWLYFFCHVYSLLFMSVTIKAQSSRCGYTHLEICKIFEWDLPRGVTWNPAKKLWDKKKISQIEANRMNLAITKHLIIFIVPAHTFGMYIVDAKLPRFGSDWVNISAIGKRYLKQKEPVSHEKSDNLLFLPLNCKWKLHDFAR